MRRDVNKGDIYPNKEKGALIDSKAVERLQNLWECMMAVNGGSNEEI